VSLAAAAAAVPHTPNLQVAPLLGHFCTPWCNALRNIRDDLEKEQAFRGLLSVVQRAPESAVEAFTALAGEHVSQGCPGGRSYAVYGQGLKVSVVQRAPQSAVEASTALAGEQVSKGWGMGAR
jgi:hypothetical protein